MTPVEELRQAATLIRERARAANSDEARVPYSHHLTNPVPETQWGALVDNYLGGPIGQHCASWTPAVALAVADWIEGEAVRIDNARWMGADADWIERNYRNPLAVARTYLGGTR